MRLKHATDSSLRRGKAQLRLDARVSSYGVVLHGLKNTNEMRWKTESTPVGAIHSDEQ